MSLMCDINYDYIIYHDKCSDGITAQWASKQRKNSDATLIAIKAGMSESLDMELFTDQNVLFVDITPSYNVFCKLILIASYVTILDHHKSGHDEFVENFCEKSKNGVLDIKYNNYHILIDMNKAGCQIAWGYFNPEVPTPWFVNYVADRDLWKWELENSKDINSAMFDKGLLCDCGLSKMKLFNKFDICKLAKQGAIINAPFNIQVEKICLEAKQAITIVNNKTFDVWLVSCTNYYKSDVGNKLSSQCFPDGNMPDFCVIWQQDPNSTDIWISLRGINEIDLNDLAKQYDRCGGGHLHAAGFTLKNIRLDEVFYTNSAMA